jgi:hypothetical protein
MPILSVNANVTVKSHQTCATTRIVRMVHARHDYMAIKATLVPAGRRTSWLGTQTRRKPSHSDGSRRIASEHGQNARSWTGIVAGDKKAWYHKWVKYFADSAMSRLTLRNSRCYFSGTRSSSVPPRPAKARTSIFRTLRPGAERSIRPLEILFSSLLVISPK